MMDCDTTGVEPDIALVKYKKLVGGGLMKIVNQTVPEALRKLGYDSEQIEHIIKYIEKNDTIEGAPYLKDEHLSVFDCAFKPAKGERSIQYMGHIKMMSAVQPFLSGAISKTVNMPTEVTPDEIMQSYIEAWKLGLKSIAQDPEPARPCRHASSDRPKRRTDARFGRGDERAFEGSGRGNRKRHRGFALGLFLARPDRRRAGSPADNLRFLQIKPVGNRHLPLVIVTLKPQLEYKDCWRAHVCPRACACTYQSFKP